MVSLALKKWSNGYSVSCGTLDHRSSGSLNLGGSLTRLICRLFGCDGLERACQIIFHAMVAKLLGGIISLTVWRTPHCSFWEAFRNLSASNLVLCEIIDERLPQKLKFAQQRAV